MRRFQFSIATGMAVTAAVGLNIALVRALAITHLGFATCVVPIGFVLQLALFRLARNRGRARMFWSGFVASGTAAMASLHGAAFFPGTIFRHMWEAYADLVVSFLRLALPGTLIVRIQNDLVLGSIIEAAAAFFLQVIVALAGGILARSIIKPSWCALADASPSSADDGDSPTPSANHLAYSPLG